MKKRILRFKVGDMVKINILDFGPKVGTITDIDTDLATPYYIVWKNPDMEKHIDWWGELFLEPYWEANDVLKDLL